LGGIVAIGSRVVPPKYNRLAVTDPVTRFKTTAIDHSAIPPRSILLEILGSLPYVAALTAQV
jgi:hypothetical protein